MDFMVFDFDAVVYFDSFPSVLFLRQVVSPQGLDSRRKGGLGAATPPLTLLGLQSCALSCWVLLLFTAEGR